MLKVQGCGGASAVGKLRTTFVLATQTDSHKAQRKVFYGKVFLSSLFLHFKLSFKDFSQREVA